MISLCWAASASRPAAPTGRGANELFRSGRLQCTTPSAYAPIWARRILEGACGHLMSDRMDIAGARSVPSPPPSLCPWACLFSAIVHVGWIVLRRVVVVDDHCVQCGECVHDEHAVVWCCCEQNLVAGAEAALRSCSGGEGDAAFGVQCVQAARVGVDHDESSFHVDGEPVSGLPGQRTHDRSFGDASGGIEVAHAVGQGAVTRGRTQFAEGEWCCCGAGLPCVRGDDGFEDLVGDR